MTNAHKTAFVPAEGIYLLNHSVGRPPVTSREAFSKGFMDAWELAGEDVWPRWLEGIDQFRLALGLLLNSDSQYFCPQVNVSSTLSKILYSLPVQENRRTIVYTQQDFPSIGFVLQQAQKAGYRLRVIPDSVDLLDAGNWAAYLSSDVALALITHVHSNTGKQVPVAEITGLTRARGVVSIIDICQSVGCVPIDLQAWQADIAMGSCVKWLCGGPGAGFLWVHPDQLNRCEPIDVGWFSHENPFEFDIDNFCYAGDALRFWGGTPSVQPFVTATNSINLLNEIGIDIIRDHNVQLTQLLADAVEPEHVVTPAQSHQRGGTMALSYAQDQLQALSNRLRNEGILFDLRSTGVRLSPHIYNDAAEIERVIECLA